MSSVIILAGGEQLVDETGTKVYAGAGGKGREEILIPGSPAVFDQITARPQAVENATNAPVPGGRMELPKGVPVVVIKGNGSSDNKSFD